MEEITVRYDQILRRIDEAKQVAPHNREVTLLAVSKRQPLSRVQALQDAIAPEQLSLGENYVQEYREKKSSLGPHIAHLIGPLQSNKAREAVSLFDVIESVHSEKIAQVLEKEAARAKREVSVFLQVNISQDQHKSGLTEEEFLELVRGWPQQHQWLHLRGVMTITAEYSSPEMVRSDYRKLYCLAERAYKAFPESFRGGLPEISMGMSDDFDIAVQEGATVVRVGSALFGPRE